MSYAVLIGGNEETKKFFKELAKDYDKSFEYNMDEIVNDLPVEEVMTDFKEYLQEEEGKKE